MLLVSFIVYFIIVHDVSGILFFKGFNDPVSWTTAETKCSCTSQLATFGSQSEYDRIKTAKHNAHNSGDVWVGLTDEDQNGNVEEGKWRFIDNDYGYCNQHGGDCDKLPQWESNQQPNGDGDYAKIMDNDLLNDASISSVSGYVCEFDCGGNNFFAAFTENVNWHTAKTRCESFNTMLATFASQSEYDMIQTARTNSGASVVWIGLTDRDNEGKWKFIDNDYGVIHAMAIVIILINGMMENQMMRDVMEKIMRNYMLDQKV
eukprot:71543_1